MPQLVEDAGGEFGAGHFNTLIRLGWNSTCFMVLSDHPAGMHQEQEPQLLPRLLPTVGLISFTRSANREKSNHTSCAVATFWPLISPHNRR